MIRWTRQEWALVEARLRAGFGRVARQLGEQHPMVQLMGGLAWGRYDDEPGAAQWEMTRG